MKLLLILLSLITFNVLAEERIKYVVESKDYGGFGGEIKDMREEYLYEVSSTGKKLIGRKVIKIEPYELRELEIGKKYWSKADPKSNELIIQFDNYAKQAIAKSGQHCEEVTEKYVICNGDRYVRDLKNNDSLKRNFKEIEDFIDSGKPSTQTSGVHK